MYAEALLTLCHLYRLRGEIIFSKDDGKMQKSVNVTYKEIIHMKIYVEFCTLGFFKIILYNMIINIYI